MTSQWPAPSHRSETGPAERDVPGLDARLRIAEATITVMAERGLAGVSYRTVAAQAATSLALVTYYYPSKFDLVRAASATVLDAYVDAFTRASQRFRTGTPPSLHEFVLRLLRNAAKRDRLRTLAWAEITLDAARHEDSLVLARAWNDNITTLWTDIADAIGVDDPPRTARSAVDTVIGLLFFTMALDLDPARIEAVLVHGGSPLEHWAPVQAAAVHVVPPATRKTAATRARILDAAIELLISDGPAAISFRAVAERAGMATTAPAYHYKSISALLSAAQLSLIQRSVERYAIETRHIDRRLLTASSLADLSATILIREATEYSQANLAFLTNWIEASRRVELRVVLWDFTRSLYIGWQKVLETTARSRLPAEAGILAFAMFIGKLVRYLSTGSETRDLCVARHEIETFFADLLAHPEGFWGSRPREPNAG